MAAALLSVCAGTIAVAQQLPADANVWAIVTRDISAKKLHVGDPIRLRVPLPLRNKDGSVLLRGETTLVGTVTEACGRDQCNGVSTLSFLITSAEWKGSIVPMRAVPVSVRPPGTPRPNGVMPPASVASSHNRAAEIAEKLKDVTVRETGDAKTVTAIVSSQADVLLPTSTVIVFRQVAAP